MAAADTTSHPNADACALLTTALPDKVFPKSDSQYTASINRYFFANDRLSPDCIVYPQSAQDVSLIVKTLAKTNAKVAIQGGGHTPNAGAANLDSGITISMQNINSISLIYGDSQLNTSSSPLDSIISASARPTSIGVNTTSPSENPIVSVGGGATFGSVYSYLNPYNLIAVGGRGDSLGVGGLLTGGGVGFFGPKYGFACDNIVSVEIVLADGSIVNANAQTRPDLFEALKGGSSNFGIVTRFHLKTYSQGQFWGGFVNYPESTIPAQLKAVGSFITTGPKTRDPNAALISLLGYVQAYGVTVATSALHYTKPIDTVPEIFKPFTDIQPQTKSSLRVGRNIDFVSEIENMQGPGNR